MLAKVCYNKGGSHAHHWRKRAGSPLVSPPGENTRPTADRVREALFNILAARLDGARVLDLFGGSGALALEALSRGAACAVIGDKDPGAVNVIRRNALSVLGEAELPRAKIVCRDYRALLASLAEPFDLVFLDPPYRMQEAYGNAMAQMQQRNLLAPDARIVAEMAAGASVPLPSGFCTLDERKYGDTKLVFVGRQE